MIETILATLGTAGAGGLTGLVGVGLKAWTQRGEAKAARAYDLEVRRLNMDEMKLEASLAVRRAEAEADSVIRQAEAEEAIAEEKGAAQIKIESYRHDAARYGRTKLGQVADFVRALVRPVITAYFAYVLLRFDANLNRLLVGLDALPVEELTRLYVLTVQTALYIATAVFLWWFGERAISKTMAAPSVRR